MLKQFNEIIKSQDLREITIEVIENALDHEISSELLKDIPVLKSIIAVKNIYTSYSDRIFIKKAMKALLELADVTVEERSKLESELTDNETKGSEKILLAIDQMETFEKCKVYGKLCKLRIQNRIKIDNFLRLTKLIQDAYLDDLILVTDFKSGERKEIHEGDYYSILTLGLIYQEPSEQKPITINHRRYNEYDEEISGGEIKFNYVLSDLGQILNEIYFELFPKSN
jgi:hypothetical protein